MRTPFNRNEFSQVEKNSMKFKNYLRAGLPALCAAMLEERTTSALPVPFRFPNWQTWSDPIAKWK